MSFEIIKSDDINTSFKEGELYIYKYSFGDEEMCKKLESKFNEITNFLKKIVNNQNFLYSKVVVSDGVRRRSKKKSVYKRRRKSRS